MASRFELWSIFEQVRLVYAKEHLLSEIAFHLRETPTFGLACTATATAATATARARAATARAEPSRAEPSPLPLAS